MVFTWLGIQIAYAFAGWWSVLPFSLGDRGSLANALGFPATVLDCPDSGRKPQDSGKTPQDSGRTPQDSGKTPQDSGRTPPDSGRSPQVLYCISIKPFPYMNCNSVKPLKTSHVAYLFLFSIECLPGWMITEHHLWWTLFLMMCHISVFDYCTT